MPETARSRAGSRLRKLQFKYCASVIAGTQRAAVILCDGLGSGKTNTVFSTFSLIETLKNMRQIILCDARTVVGNGDERAAIFRPAGQIDLTFCVADRVGNEIAEQTLRILLADRDPHGCFIEGETE